VVSWWNPFAWTPGAGGPPGAAGGRDEREEDAGIWGGPGAPGGLHAGMVLGEGSVLGAVVDSPVPVEVAFPSDIVAGYGSVGAGVRGDRLGGLRTIGAGLSETDESAWRAFTATPIAGAPIGGAVADVGAGLPDARGLGEDTWADDVTFTR
jgi:hypothetical protein